VSALLVLGAAGSQHLAEFTSIQDMPLSARLSRTPVLVR